MSVIRSNIYLWVAILGVVLTVFALGVDVKGMPDWAHLVAGALGIGMATFGMVKLTFKKGD